MCDQCIKICNAIGELRNTEGSSVEMVADNADFDGPNSLIYCKGDWTNWESEKFTGDSVVQALEKAVEQKRLAEQPNHVDVALAKAGILGDRND